MVLIWNRFVDEKAGADLLEYAFIAGLVAFGCLLAMSTVGTSLNGFFTSVSSRLSTVLP
jgi:pilus assembly protein Flp/PilA